MFKIFSSRSRLSWLSNFFCNATLATTALLFSACTFDTSGLTPVSTNNATCGNGTLEAPEICDGGDLGGQTCASRGFDSGVLTCLGTCAGFDTSNCEGTGPVCGDGTIEAPEVCDGTRLDGQTCASQGFLAGDLACAAGCLAFDTTGCSGLTCGNGIIDGIETCDGADVGEATCLSLGFVGGALLCASNCLALDTSSCLGQLCNNGTIETPELCDGTNFNGATCASEGYFSGELACVANCMALDISGCTMCGNRQIDFGEVCDGDAGITQTCADLGCRVGEVTCAADCLSVSMAGCYSGHDEDTDGVDDNCDNCPTIPNDPQTDSDQDGLGDECEAPGGPTQLSRIVVFEPFTNNAGNWSSYYGNWNWGTDHVQGDASGGGNYLHNDQLAGAIFSLEGTFYYPEPAGMSNNWVALVFGWQTTAGVQSAGWECTYERELKELAIYKYTITGWSKQTQVTVTTSAADGQWHRMRIFNSAAGVRCVYADEAGGAGSLLFSDTASIGSINGKPGLRVYTERAVFTSFATYQ